MEKNEILTKISVGSRVAEDEQQNLKKYFLKTQIFQDFLDDKIDIIYGSKGTGKSAIYLHALESKKDFDKDSIKVIQAENIRGESAFSSVVNNPPTEESIFRNLWKLYFLTLINREQKRKIIINKKINSVTAALRRSGLEPGKKNLLAIFSDAYFYLTNKETKSIEGGISFDPISQLPTGISTKVEFSDIKDKTYNINDLFFDSNEFLKKKKKNYWILIDRLDSVFEENEELEENAIRGLFKAYLDLRIYTNIRVKIFLRSDIWNKISKKGFREASHITRYSTVKWNEENILNLIIKRFIENKEIQDFYSVNKETISKQFHLQQELFYRIFPERVEHGSNKSVTLRWIISHTYDGTENITPREIIHLLLELVKLQAHEFIIGKDQTEKDNLFSRNIFKEALVDVSKTRMEQTVFAEFPSLRDVIMKLKSKKATNSRTSLMEIFSCDEQDLLAQLESLIEIGVLKKTTYKKEEYFDIPFIYRPYLDSKQGRNQ